ncbi:MAG TPA: S26 family signal peptidase [Methanoregulaceae archaeon]|nr:S26 family signal peptidase [Methanoregulaceae archaeon]HQA80134.1 S26 family signal peptidase [Methanoregulaceae archaeon]
MVDPKKKAEEKSLIGALRTSEHPGIAFAREIIWIIAVVAGIALVLYLASGTWPAVVTIESESMVPHMNVGDLVFVVEENRYGALQTWQSGRETGYMKFDEYGDVLIYSPNGAEGALIPGLGGGIHPIIHRAMDTTEGGTGIPVYYYFYPGQSSPDRYLPVTIDDNAWILEDSTIVARIQNGIIIPDKGNATPDEGYIVTSEQVSRNGGYLTKGDNNVRSDQGSYLSRSELGVIQPVKPEWIVGKAFFAIPLIGYIPLNIIPVAIILILVMVGWEYYQRRKSGESGKKQEKEKK